MSTMDAYSLQAYHYDVPLFLSGKIVIRRYDRRHPGMGLLVLKAAWAKA
jgi:hypothetical protein